MCAVGLLAVPAPLQRGGAPRAVGQPAGRGAVGARRAGARAAHAPAARAARLRARPLRARARVGAQSCQT